ncbi:ABC transporter permease [Catellatospora citrea]|uniref:ABC transporter permease n=1 Tax=Catellatospora citrea TaxID=53366 RepID=A0A8J3NXT6_9ACTN|nr:ABC transporter permease [Catellatospora citrea]RKE12720.1 taurine transport system permease protein [Catellatospora citrea]GIF96041.1 ABC transporter permease [Catellatospora citrea]
MSAPTTAAATSTSHRGRTAALRAGAVVVFVIVWWAVAAAEIWPPVFVPSPQSVWHRFLDTSGLSDAARPGWAGYTLGEHLWASLRRMALGCAYGISGGLLLGLLIGLLPAADAVLGPAVTFLRTLPPLAYLSLLVIWFGIDESPKVWLLLLAALPPVAVATADAVRGVPADYLHAARSLGTGRALLPWRVLLPAAAPEILTGVRLAVGVAYTTVVAAETINGVPGIGGMIRDAQRYNQTDVVVLGIILIGLSGLAFDGLLQLAQRRLTPWRGRV